MYIKDNDKKTLMTNGDDDTRIGPDNRRNAKGKSLDRIEKLIRATVTDRVSLDTCTNTGPYFDGYTYSDVLGGIRLATNSMEINARILDTNLSDCEELPPFDISVVYDKYAMVIPEGQDNIPGAVFLPGPNVMSFVRVDDISDLVTEGWKIKPHPVSDEPFLEALVRRSASGTLIDSKTSGLYVFGISEAIATTAASEFLVLAALSKKPCRDITRRVNRWQCINGDISMLMLNEDIDGKYRVANCALMHPKSGYLHPSMSDEEIVQRIHDYSELAEELRKPFKSIMEQSFIVADMTVGPIEEAAYVIPAMNRNGRKPK